MLEKYELIGWHSISEPVDDWKTTLQRVNQAAFLLTYPEIYRFQTKQLFKITLLLIYIELKNALTVTSFDIWCVLMISGETDKDSTLQYRKQ